MTLAAGAGSGKTSVLVQRVLAVLRSGVDPSTVAAITFTDKAAGELRARVRDALERGAEASSSSSSSSSATTAATESVARALALFGDLTITTIHAFCAELLRAEALEAAFAPGTSVGAADVHSEVLLGAVSAWREGLLHRHGLVRRLVDDGASFAQLGKAAEAMVRLRDHRPIVSDVAFDVDVARAEVATLAAAIADLAGHCQARDTCKLIAGNVELVDAITTAASDVSGEAVLRLLWSDQKVRKAGIAKQWGGHKEDYIDAIDRVGAWRLRWQESAHGEVVRDLMHHLVPLVVQRKQDASIATFDDLLSETARVLRTSAGARARLASRARVLLIDEVQDTDPLQAEIAALLTNAGEPGAADGAADGAVGATEAGRLFVVGDPRQSIYRFRGADVDTFQRLQDHVGAVGESHTLTANFRSVPALVAWVNHTFQTLPGYVDQVARRPAATLDPVVVIEAGGDGRDDDDDDNDDAGIEDDGIDDDNDGPDVGADASEVADETLAVIAHVQGLINAGATVVDRDTGRSRALAPKDVMVLLPAWRKADAIADAMRAHGLPAIVEGGDTFFRRDEVRLGVCALRSLVEPADTEATAMVLRGLFGLSLEAMAAHVATGGSLRFTVPVTVPGAVGDALGLLATLHRQRGRTSLPMLLDAVLAGARTLGVWALLPDRDARLANLDKLKAIVRELESTTTSPLQAVEALQARQRQAADKDIDRLDDDGDAVRITSLFKAKGLEAPVVVLMAMNRAIKGPDVIVDHVAGTAAVQLSKRLRPAGWPELAREERLRSLAERRRWMYVAATRARDQLVVCRTLAETKKGFVAPNLLTDDLARGLPPVSPSKHADADERDDDDDVSDDGDDDVSGGVDGARWSPTDAPDVVVKVRWASLLLARATEKETFPGHDAVVDGLLRSSPGVGDADGERWASAWQQRTRAAERACLRWRRASNEKGSVRLDPGRPVEIGAEAAVDGGGGSSASVGARVGRVVHGVMERLDLSQPASSLTDVAADLVTVLSTSALLSVDEARATGHIVRRILSHPALKDVQRAPERWHEVPFTVTQPKRSGPPSMVAGTIDLCFPVDVARTRWVVIDWKSKVPGVGTALRAKYEAQLDLYARALLHTMDSVGSIADVQTAIVGPYPELQAVVAAAGEHDDAAAELLVDAPANLRPMLTQLIELGHELPELDSDLDDDLPAVGDVVFRAARVALVQEAGQIDDDTRALLLARGWRLVDDGDALVALLGPGPEQLEQLEHLDDDQAGQAGQAGPTGIQP